MNESLFSFGPEVYTKRKSNDGLGGARGRGGEGSNVSPCLAALCALDNNKKMKEGLKSEFRMWKVQCGGDNKLTTLYKK